MRHNLFEEDKWNWQYNYDNDTYENRITNESIYLNSVDRYTIICNQLINMVNRNNISIMCLQEVDNRLLTILTDLLPSEEWTVQVGIGQGEPSDEHPEWAFPYTISKRSPLSDKYNII